MFKNLTIYRVQPGWKPGIGEAETALESQTFVECAATQDLSVGWVPPREENGALVESVAGHRIMKLMIETKTVPSTAVLKHARAQAEHIEATTGRKPGRKQMKELKEDALLALLPQAFPKQTAVLVWIDHDSGWLVHDAGSQEHGDHVVTALVRAFDGLALNLLQTQLTPQTIMTSWLVDGDKLDDDDRWGFAVERETELKACDESKATVRFKNHCLDTDEVKKHIAEGKLPTHLALSWKGRIACTLTEGMQLKKIDFLEGVLDDAGQDDADEFDTDVTLACGEFRNLIPDLVEALGGELVVGTALPDAPGA